MNASRWMGASGMAATQRVNKSSLNGDIMKKTRKKLFTKLTRYVFLLVLVWPVSRGGYSEAKAQHLTSTFNAQSMIEDSFYSVSLYSESIAELKSVISVEAEETPVKEVLEQIVREANLGLAYNAELLMLKKPISIRLRNVTVVTALEQVLKGTGFEATISRMKEIVLKETSGPQQLPEVPIEQTIKGTVTDAETGEPLPGVNVVVPGTNVGTSTDGAGQYSLTVSDEADSLIFSFIGYKRQTVPINNRTTINIQLTADIQAFEDIVVTALGITRKERSIGYSTQEVDGDELTFTKEQNVIGSLAGKIAGVQVVGASGASMGGTQKIKIRGVNSISGQGEPLIVVDGTPVSNANFAEREGTDYGNMAQDINPNDIESVNVLKGPAASALYGIRGQYGVVMITTKDGSGTEDVMVEYNSSFSLQQASNFMPMQNMYGGGSSQEWNRLDNGDPYVQFGVDESWGPKMDGTPVRQFYSFFPQDPQYGELTPFSPHPNNIKNFFETGNTLDQGITISGGGEHSTYRLSFNDTGVEGVYPNTSLHRNNVGINAGIDASEQWNFSVNLSYATNRANRPAQGSEYGSRYIRQWFQRSADMNRLKDYKYDDGTILQWNLGSPDGNGEMASLTPLYWNNPYFDAYENTTEDSRNRIFGDVGATFQPLPYLSFSGFIRGDMYIQNIEGKSAVAAGQLGGYSVGKYENREMNYEFLAQYTRNWKGFSLDATLGSNLYDRRYSYIRQNTEGGLTTPGWYNIDASADRPSTASYLLEKKIFSAYGLVSLGYDDTYFVDVSLRNDKSSTLPEDNNSYWYPSVSGSFVFSELIDWEPLAFGKVRLSYAQAGSDLNPYETTPVYDTGTVYGGVNTQEVPDNINNPNIKPSFATSYEAGIDLNFFQRLELGFTYYQQRNKNQIIPLNISGASGYGSATINAGLIENKGIELSLSGTPIQRQNFSWNADFNINRNQNQVVELHPDIDVYNHDYTEYSDTYSYLNSYEGETFGSLVGTAYQRDAATGKILLDENNYPLYTDATHNFGSVLPDFNGGFQNVFHYKNFSLAAMISFQVGGQFFSRSLMLAATTGLAPETVDLNDLGNNVRDPLMDASGNMVDYIDEQGEEVPYTSLPSDNTHPESGGVKINGISADTGEEVTAYLDAYDYYHAIPRDVYEDWVVDASYIKLSEVRLGYSFGNRIIERLPVRTVGVALFANNPLMIWQEAPKGLDPSELSMGSQSISWFESGQLNTVRSYGVNLNITF